MVLLGLLKQLKLPYLDKKSFTILDVSQTPTISASEDAPKIDKCEIPILPAPINATFNIV